MTESNKTQNNELNENEIASNKDVSSIDSQEGVSNTKVQRKRINLFKTGTLLIFTIIFIVIAPTPLFFFNN